MELKIKKLFLHKQLIRNADGLLWKFSDMIAQADHSES